jgi:diguanylate cyclase (GGDEF)-like protein/PAS domain S-box-containing protein
MSDVTGRPGIGVLREQFEDEPSTSRRKLETTLGAFADAVVMLRADGRIEFANAAAQRLLGVEAAGLRGQPVQQMVRLLDAGAQPIDLLSRAGAGGEVMRGSGYLRTAEVTIDVTYVASPIEAEEGGTVVVLRDVTAEQRLALRLSFEAAHDPLTGLPNRRAFLERLDDAVRGARERGEHHAVAFLDLDRFKVVNDRFGHAAGDRLLREIGAVMGRVVRGADMLARIGGDEFALLLSNCGLDDGRRIAAKLQRAVAAHRVEQHGETLGVGVSVGLAPIDAETPSAAQALADADAACYRAKSAGRGTVEG